MTSQKAVPAGALLLLGVVILTPGEALVGWCRWILAAGCAALTLSAVAVVRIIQKRKEGEESLRKALRAREKEVAEQEAVLESLSEGVVISDPDGHSIRWNRSALAMFGHATAEEARNVFAARDTMFELATESQNPLPPEQWPLVRILRGETLRDQEMRVRRLDQGWERIFHYSGTQALDRQGNAVAAVISVTDVTAQRKVEAALRAVSDNTADCIVLKDAEGRLLFANPALARALGMPLEQLVGKSSEEYISDPDILRGIVMHERAVLDTGVPQIVEEDFPTAEGVRVFLVTRAPWRDNHGKIIGLVGIGRDITDRKASEEAAHQWQRAFEQAAIGIALVSPDAESFLAVNRAFARQHGFRPEELIRAPVASLYPPEMPGPRLEHFRDLDRSDGHRVFEAVHQRKDGSRFPVLVDVTAVCDDRGRPISWVAYVLDLTGRKEAEAEVRHLNAQLERRVRERTAQLEAANQELEAFSYSVSHDLRAPLRGIDGWSLALLEDYGAHLDDRARQYLNRVRSETQHMGRLIDDLLQLSRVTRAEMRLEPVDLTVLAQEIAARMREQHPDRQIEFAIQSGLKTEGDPRLLSIALTNLLDNAVKFTARRETARIEFGKSEIEGGWAFYVRDNGAGFDMRYAATLFGAFQRLHRPSEFPGTGIGLATVHRVVRRHNGRVWAEAKVDQGATFYFTVEVAA